MTQQADDWKYLFKARARAGLVLVLSIVFALPPGLSAAKDKDGAAAGPPKMVRVTKAALRPMEKSVSAVGSLAAYEKVTISTKIAGRVARTSVDLGARLRQGQELVRLEDSEYRHRLERALAQLAQARARLGLPPEGENDAVEPESTSLAGEAAALLADAARKRERYRKLAGEGYASRAEMETVESAYDVASNRHREALEEIRLRQGVLAERRAEVALARQELAETVVRAPFAAAVQERRVGPGEYLIVGTPLFVLVRNDFLRLRLQVPEKDAGSIKEGQVVRIHAGGGDSAVHRGRIRRLSPAISESNRMLLVEADVPAAGGLLPGRFVRAEIVVDAAESAVTVPESALLRFAGVEKVVGVKDGRAKDRPVRTGRRAGGFVEITSGIKAGDTVILVPGTVRSGQPVGELGS